MAPRRSLCICLLLLFASRAPVFVSSPRGLGQPRAQPRSSLQAGKDEVRGSRKFELSLADYAYLKSRRILGVVFFASVYAVQQRLGVATPMAGLLLVFASMLGLERFNDQLAQQVFRALEPGYRFLVKWIVVFFVPALVKVSLIDAKLHASDFVHLLLLLCVGFVATFATTAGISRIFPAVEPLEAPEPVPTRSGVLHRRTLLRAPYMRFVVAMVISMAVGSLSTSWQSAAQGVYMVSASLLAFNIGKRMPADVQTYVHPLFLCAGGTFASAAAWATFFGDGLGMMDLIKVYSMWPGGGALLNFLLPTTVVSLGLLLFENRSLLRRDLLAITLTALVSTCFTISSVPVMIRILALPRPLALAAVSRCAMSPVAIGVAEVLGAPAALAVAMTTFSGLLGVVIREPLFSLLGLRQSRRARGMALGCSAHGIGVVPLASYDKQSFAYGCVGFVLVGVFTGAAVQVPQLRALLLRAIPP